LKVTKMPQFKVNMFADNYDFFTLPIWYVKKQTKDYTMAIFTLF